MVFIFSSSAIIFMFLLPVIILKAPFALRSLTVQIKGRFFSASLDKVTHAMLFFVVMMQSLNRFVIVFSCSFSSSLSKRLIAEIAESRDADKLYLFIMYLAKALVLIRFLAKSFCIAASLFKMLWISLVMLAIWLFDSFFALRFLLYTNMSKFNYLS